MKDLCGKIFKNKGMISGIGLAMVVIFGIGFYGVTFIQQGNLIFRSEDYFILGLIGFVLLLLALLFIWLIIDRQKVYNLLYEIIDILADNHDNDILEHRSTKEIILELCGKHNKGGAKDETR